jgi:hypothetical protein
VTPSVVDSATGPPWTQRSGTLRRVAADTKARLVRATPFTSVNASGKNAIRSGNVITHVCEIGGPDQLTDPIFLAISHPLPTVIHRR